MCEWQQPYPSGNGKLRRSRTLLQHKQACSTGGLSRSMFDVEEALAEAHPQQSGRGSLAHESMTA